MKTCAICMTTNLDDAATCQACGEGSWAAQSAPVVTREATPAREPEREERPRAQPARRGGK